MMAEHAGSSTVPIFVDVGQQLQEPAPPAATTLTTESSEVKKSVRQTQRCSECLRFTTDDDEKMLRHVRKVHRGENPFQCFMCEYSTYNKAVFEEHVRVHQGIKPFKCSFCPYKSASKKNTKKHELIHRPNNPLRCPSCPFIARHCRGLTKHQETHTDPTVLKCPSCNVTFKNKASLEKHKKLCPKCSKNICSETFEKHLLWHDRVKKSIKSMFTCVLCGWEGLSTSRILLHLIHHPSQEPPEGVDVSVLTKCGIRVGAPNMY